VLTLHHPVVVLGPGQLVHNAVALLPMRVEIIDPSTLEVTHLLLDLHMEFSNVILNSIFPFK